LICHLFPYTTLFRSGGVPRACATFAVSILHGGWFVTCRLCAIRSAQFSYTVRQFIYHTVLGCRTHELILFLDQQPRLLFFTLARSEEHTSELQSREN